MIFTLGDINDAASFISSRSSKLGAHVYLNNEDAKLKYSYLLREASKLGLNKDSRVLEVGAGDGHLSRYLARAYGCKVDAVDIVRRRYILDRPPRPSGIPKRVFGNLRRWLGSTSKVHYAVTDCSEFIRIASSNSYDLVIDGCSVIHFHETQVSNKNEYSSFLSKDYSNILRILKSGGCFVTATDVAFEDTGARVGIYLQTEQENRKLLAGVGFEFNDSELATSKTRVPSIIDKQLNEYFLRVKATSFGEPYLVAISGLNANKP
jgi:SAM-dependent methyltransferase